MPPAKPPRGVYDDIKLDSSSTKEKNGHSINIYHGNGKMRRVVSSAGSNLREVINASSEAAGTSAAGIETPTAPQETATTGLQWPAFDRDELHAYRRAHRLNTPPSFSSEYHHWVLTQSGSIGLFSPTIARRKELRRQPNEQLNNTVRKHFNNFGVQENDVIVEFLHKVRTTSSTAAKIKKKPKKKEYINVSAQFDK